MSDRKPRSGCSRFVLVVFIILAIVSYFFHNPIRRAISAAGFHIPPLTYTYTFTGKFYDPSFPDITFQATPIIPPKALSALPSDYVRVQVTIGQLTFSTDDPQYQCIQGLVPLLFDEELAYPGVFLAVYNNCGSIISKGQAGLMMISHPLIQDSSSDLYVMFTFPQDAVCSTNTSGQRQCLATPPTLVPPTPTPTLTPVPTATPILGPIVSGITPTRGPASGGTSITLSGAHFSNTTGVSFGSTTTSNFTVDSDTQITVVSPAGSSGTVDVTVTTAGGTSATSSNDQFTYIPLPVVSHISPAISASTRTTVTITGSGFTGATGVFFGSTPADSFTVDNDTQITAVATFEGAKTVDVTVTTAGGTSATSSNDQFTYYIIG